MKKKYLDASLNPYLSSYQSKIIYCQERSGYVFNIYIESLKGNIPVDYEGADRMLFGEGYNCILFMPDHENWCISAIYDDRGDIVEWYVDITAEHGVDDRGPYFVDLYLDYAVSPDKKVTFLDEDELLAAYNNKVIDQDLVTLAYTASQHVRKHVLTDQDLMEDYLRSHIDLCRKSPSDIFGGSNDSSEKSK